MTVRRWLMLVPFLLLSAGAILVGRNYGPGAWYDALHQPALTPPGWVFGVAWTILYTLIAVAGWLLAINAPRSAALKWWFVQLALNVAWSWLFFGLHRMGLALVEIVALWLAIAATVVLAWRCGERLAATLLLPYLAWVAFATLLNWQFLRLNG